MNIELQQSDGKYKKVPMREVTELKNTVTELKNNTRGVKTADQMEKKEGLVNSNPRQWNSPNQSSKK